MKSSAEILLAAAFITMAQATTFTTPLVRSASRALEPSVAMAAGAMLPGPAPLREGVAGAVARTWQVPAEAVALDWSHAGALDTLARVYFQLKAPWRDGRALLTVGLGERSAPVVIRAGVRESAAFATRPVAAGATLEDADLRFENRVRWGAPEPAPVRPAAGWRARRAISAGEALSAPAVAPPSLVHVGEPVALEWSSGTVRISMSGVALNAASAGDVVHVRVEGRPGRHAAVVTAPGRATLAGDRP